MSKAIHKMKNGTQYVYESTSYWDKVKKTPRTKLKYLTDIPYFFKTGISDRVFVRKQISF